MTSKRPVVQGRHYSRFARSTASSLGLRRAVGIDERSWARTHLPATISLSRRHEASCNLVIRAKAATGHLPGFPVTKNPRHGFVPYLAALLWPRLPACALPLPSCDPCASEEDTRCMAVAGKGGTFGKRARRAADAIRAGSQARAVSCCVDNRGGAPRICTYT